MSDDMKLGGSGDNPAKPDEIGDEALDQAEGGFALSGMFTKTVQPPMRSFSNLDTSAFDKINVPEVNLEEVTTNFVRKRPGRKSF